MQGTRPRGCLLEASLLHKPQVMCHYQVVAHQVAPMRQAWGLHSTLRVVAPPVVATANNRKGPKEEEHPSRNTPKGQEGRLLLAEVPLVAAVVRPLQLPAHPLSGGCHYGHCAHGHSCSSIGCRLPGPCRAQNPVRNFDRRDDHLGRDYGDHCADHCGCHPVGVFHCTSALDRLFPRPRPLAPRLSSFADSLCPAKQCGFGCCPLPQGRNGHM